MHQHRLWQSHTVRDARRAAAEAYLGRRLELDDLPPRQVAALVLDPRGTKKRRRRR